MYTFKQLSIFITLALTLNIFASDHSKQSDIPRNSPTKPLEILTSMKLGYHRGHTDIAQENSKSAIVSAFESRNPNIEVDITNFMNDGEEVGLLVHENEMKRITGLPGIFQRVPSLESLPENRANPNLPAEPIISVVDLFELIKKYKQKGVTPIVSLDIKIEKKGKSFGKWLGKLIKKYGFEKHVFASSFWKESLDGIKSTCNECYIGGIVFKDHWALRFLSTKFSSLDLNKVSRILYFLRFPGKKQVKHDFILIHDEEFFKDPELAHYWKQNRGVGFVGIFTQQNQGTYSLEQWELIKEYGVKWVELSPEHIESK